MHSKLALVLVFALGLSTVQLASAADMPVKAVAAPAPVFSWNGIYIGVHAGAGWGSKNFDFNDLTPAAPFLWESSISSNGFLGGGQVGYNWQNGWTVFGVEFDASAANRSEEH